MRGDPGGEPAMATGVGARAACMPVTVSSASSKTSCEQGHSIKKMFTGQLKGGAIKC